MKSSQYKSLQLKRCGRLAIQVPQIDYKVCQRNQIVSTNHCLKIAQPWYSSEYNWHGRRQKYGLSGLKKAINISKRQKNRNISEKITQRTGIAQKGNWAHRGIILNKITSKPIEPTPSTLKADLSVFVDSNMLITNIIGKNSLAYVGFSSTSASKIEFLELPIGTDSTQFEAKFAGDTNLQIYISCSHINSGRILEFISA